MPGWTGKLITSLGMISDKMDKSPPKTGKFWFINATEMVVMKQGARNGVVVWPDDGSDRTEGVHEEI
jgi:hypothetical protein